ncbi:MAG: GNAT family N-acetyltransferase [Acidimicrobiales bacterium]|nr:GNAT family N-acetyltransferase [Acidimicrobiales bacterium]
MLSQLWPLFGLRVRTPRLELRPPGDDELALLAGLASRGVHDPATMPFLVPWTDLPSPRLEQGVLQYHWRARAEWAPDAWRLELGVFTGGELVGSQGLFAQRFGIVRTVETGSWLGREHQGRGIGTEMRAAVLHLAFAGLGARVAYSGAFESNAASVAVSRALGYADNGQRWVTRRAEPARELLFRLERAVWEERRRDDITIEGLEACLELFGLAHGGDGSEASAARSAAATAAASPSA